MAALPAIQAQAPVQRVGSNLRRQCSTLPAAWCPQPRVPAMQDAKQPDAGIAVPPVRDVANYADTNANALPPEARYSQLDPTTTAYFRYQDRYGSQTTAQVVEDYDMDSEDEAWLSKYNCKVCVFMDMC